VTVEAHPLLDALGLPEDADRATKIVAVVAAMVAESFDVELDEARVPVEDAAQTFLRSSGRRGGERAAVARFGEALATRLAETFTDRVSDELVRELADRRGDRLIGDDGGVRLSGLSEEGTRREACADVAYLAVNVARDVCREDEPTSAVPRPAGLEGWVS
jgi:hypothetical protein